MEFLLLESYDPIKKSKSFSLNIVLTTELQKTNFQ